MNPRPRPQLTSEERDFLRAWMWEESHPSVIENGAKTIQVKKSPLSAPVLGDIIAAIMTPEEQLAVVNGPQPTKVPEWPWGSDEELRCRHEEAKAWLKEGQFPRAPQGRSLGIALIFVVSFCLVGCGGDKTPKEAQGKTPSAQGEARRGSLTGKQVKESEARAVLKAALDSWVFGDTLETFEKDHPDIHFGDLDRAVNKVLLKYELGPTRQKDKVHEYSVILVFQSGAGTEIRKSATYTVVPPEGSPPKWGILGGAN